MKEVDQSGLVAKKQKPNMVYFTLKNVQILHKELNDMCQCRGKFFAVSDSSKNPQFLNKSCGTNS